MMEAIKQIVETTESAKWSIKKVFLKKSTTPNNTIEVNKKRMFTTKSLDLINRISSKNLMSIGFKPS